MTRCRSPETTPVPSLCTGAVVAGAITHWMTTVSLAAWDAKVLLDLVAGTDCLECHGRLPSVRRPGSGQASKSPQERLNRIRLEIAREANAIGKAVRVTFSLIESPQRDHQAADDQA